MKKFGAIFALFGALFMSIGIGLAWNQQHRIAVSLPMQAEVLAKRVDVKTSSNSDGGSSTTYKPIVEYRYTVDGATYNGDSVLPMSMSAGSAWAHRVIAPFKVGSTVEGFYHPTKPHKSFLLKRASFFPYIFILFPMIFVAVGVGIAFGSGASKRNPPTPVASTEGWYEVAPGRSLQARRKAAWIGALLWSSVGVIVCGHYFLVARPDFETIAYVFSGIYAGLSLVGIGIAVYYTLLAQNIADAQMYIQGDQVHLGEALTIGGRQQMRKSLMIEEARVGLVCTAATRTKSGSKTTYSSHTSYEELETVMENHRSQAGEHLNYSCHATVPVGQHASSPPGQKSYPRYTWSIRLKIKIDGSPDYRSDFPVTVTA